MAIEECRAVHANGEAIIQADRERASTESQTAMFLSKRQDYLKNELKMQEYHTERLRLEAVTYRDSERELLTSFSTGCNGSHDAKGATYHCFLWVL